MAPFARLAIEEQSPVSLGQLKLCKASSCQHSVPVALEIALSLEFALQAFPEGNNPAICNENLPNDSVYHRFLYIIQVLKLLEILQL